MMEVPDEKRSDTTGSARESDWPDLSGVDFLDLGCSRGGSIAYCRKRFGAGVGVGVDNDPRKVEEAKAAGVRAVVADARTLRLPNEVRFVSMMQFLEHLPDLSAVESVISSACETASDFIFIHHPSFEGEEYLQALGLRQYWWHWRGHPAHVQVSDYCRMFDRIGAHQYMIRYIHPIESSDHPSILPSSAPIDQFDYDATKHAIKPSVRFLRPVWRFQEIFIATRPVRAKDWTRITAPRPQ
jgi:SAM-dependent methyltransferase